MTVHILHQGRVVIVLGEQSLNTEQVARGAEKPVNLPQGQGVIPEIRPGDEIEQALSAGGEGSLTGDMEIALMMDYAVLSDYFYPEVREAVDKAIELGYDVAPEILKETDNS